MDILGILGQWIRIRMKTYADPKHWFVRVPTASNKGRKDVDEKMFSRQSDQKGFQTQADGTDQKRSCSVTNVFHKLLQPDMCRQGVDQPVLLESLLL